MKYSGTGKKYEQYPDYVPVANALFFSANAGENEIFGNEIVINHENPGTDALAYAFYIGGARFGRIYNNHIITNVTPIWVGSAYGPAEDTKISGNLIEKAQNTILDFTPVRIGARSHGAKGTIFRSNEFRGMEFGIDATDHHHSYSVYWTLTLNTMDKTGEHLDNVNISLRNKNGELVEQKKSRTFGSLTFELPEYRVDGKDKTMYSPYTISYGKQSKVVELKENKVIDLKLR